MSNIRNFCIIAHIDHGKSTLADRILEKTGALEKREEKPQYLDTLDIERKRGITIKLNAVELNYKGYKLNLIDTPGHVDFTYEVSRSLAACEGAILIVDATQGVEAQTLSNLYLALDNNLKIIPVINKIDLDSSDVDSCVKQLENLGFDEKDIIRVSAKTGVGIDELLESIIKNVPEPKVNFNSPLRCLIFDSSYSSYKGVIVSIRVVDGVIHVGDKIKMMETGSVYEVLGLSISTPHEKEVDKLESGEVGFLYASIKSIEDVKVGDTIIHEKDTNSIKLPGYKPMKPMVYSSIYPIDTSKFESLREDLAKLKLNDAALIYTVESSPALGYGFRCGFLGLLHLEVTIERLEEEFNQELIATIPSVIYRVNLTNSKQIEITTASDLPRQELIKTIEEPFVNASIFTPSDYIGSIMKLCQDRRGEFVNIDYIDEQRAIVKYILPLSEVIYNFFDNLKSISHGYASFDYEFLEYRVSDLVKLDILINKEKVDALSIILHKSLAYSRGSVIVDKLKDSIPRQLFEISIQASIGGNIIKRANVKALRKDVLAKCYGGDITRKKKLLEKQKQGKKKMKMIGNVELPKEAFLSIVKGVDND